MKVLYFGSYDPRYGRNVVISEGLARAGVEVTHCHHPDEPTYVPTPRNLTRFARMNARLLQKARKLEFDVIFVGHPGQRSFPSAWLLKHLNGTPLVFDPFVSLYNTFVNDWGLPAPGSLAAQLIRVFEGRLLFNPADLLLSDTRTHAKYFSKELGTPLEKFRTLYIGCDDRLFFPRELPLFDQFTVLFYGNYIPLQGVPTIFKAAKILTREAPQVRFIVIGGDPSNPIFRKVRKYKETRGLDNVTMGRRIPQPELVEYLARSHVTLGIFGNTPKTKMVIPNKAFEALASARPLLTADTPASRELLVSEKNALLCPPSDPKALADAIVGLLEDDGLRERLGKAGHQTFLEHCSPDVLGKRLKGVLEEALALK